MTTPSRDSATVGGTSVDSFDVRLKLLGIQVSIRTPHSELASALEFTYRAFLAGPSEPIALQMELRARGDSFVLVSPDGHFEAPAGAEATLLQALLGPVVRRATTHLVLHAGVIAHQGRAVLLVAPSNVGKSTLTLAMVNRGYTFLSDELAPLRRSDLRVEPFPRAAGVREGSFQLLDKTSHTLGPLMREPDGHLKRLVAIKSNALATQPYEVGHVLLIEPPSDPTRTPLRRVELCLSEVRPALLSQLRTVEGVREVEQLDDLGGRPRLRLGIDLGAHVVPEIGRLVEETGALVSSVVPRATETPDYNAEPSLTAVEPAAALLELAPHLQNGAGSRLLESGYSGRVSELLFSLSSLARTASFARLVVGQLDRMVTLTEEFIERKA